MRQRKHFFVLLFVLASSGCSSSNDPSASAADAGASNDASRIDAASQLDAGKNDAAIADSCDPVRQTGCLPGAPKCTLFDDGTNTNTAKPECTAAGTAPVGDPCTRTSESASGIGHDTCAAGAYCSGVGEWSTPPVRHCRKFCGADTECSGGQRCSALVTKKVGACVPTCTLFGGDCGTTMNCSVLVQAVDGVTTLPTCRMPGTVALGAKCAALDECVPDSYCADPQSSGSFTCVALCDDAHPCKSGTCTAVGKLPLGGGYCR